MQQSETDPHTPPPVEASLDFTGDDSLSGFRLKKLEVFNWGTFDGQVWTLNLDGRNGLLTGDIGSGKSTLVDAITTLLIPANKVDYNKAAGAQKKERDLRSYVLGYYKSERNAGSGRAKPVALRDQNGYAVILGEFYNAGYDKTVSLAQVFWIKDIAAQPQRFYVAAERPLTIKQDFAGFGSDISALRKRLRKNHCDVNDHFPPYGAWFRRRLGINNSQAMDLFHQTVSMKSVGNLTEFVRHHMLEPFEVVTRIDKLIAHFDDLNQAHESVLKARQQIQALTPLIADCDSYQQLTLQNRELRACRDTLAAYFGDKKCHLLKQRELHLQQELDRHQTTVQRLSEQEQQQQRQQQELKQQIAEHGGDRIERLQQEIQRMQRERERRASRASRYQGLLEPLALAVAENSEDFIDQQNTLQQKQAELQQQQSQLNNQQREVEFDFLRHKEKYRQLKQSIKELKSRQSNIDQTQILIRQQLCTALSLKPDELPFAGELLQVREEDKNWEGAIERLLHNFGLSMLVPEEYYREVARWVDDTHLRGRLVYYRVRPVRAASLPDLHPDSLVRKLAIKTDSAFYSWLEQEISRRFDLACCETQQQFQREKQAITRHGQIKSSAGRHEKDDRFALNDRSRFILGWSNLDKIAALENNKRQLERDMADLATTISKLEQQDKTLQRTLTAIDKLEEYNNFDDIDWQPLARQIAAMQAEVQQLESASDILQTLTEQLKTQQQAYQKLLARLDKNKAEQAKTEQKIDDTRQLYQTTLAQLKEMKDNRDAAGDKLADYSKLESLLAQALGEYKLTLSSCDHQQQQMRKWLQEKIDNQGRKIHRLQEKIVRAMSDYKNAFKLETQEVDAAVEAADDYRTMLTELQADDLPRFEQRFKELLNENTIREVANFQSQLHREREEIRERIEQINDSLTRIDYNPARYIRLEAQPSQDADVRDFQTDLRACTEGALTGSEDEQYSEAKFLQVKQIIQRFRGREGLSDLDKRWTEKVSDVRNWFSFAASERWREDDTEYEHYSDSGGKSGGQKEKLAYTILAASLAYQFGLEWGELRSRTFRFVVIDEAFGRGSDESAEYGLKLFQQLNLQLLIVTPLQKIHIIEPYVASVGFVQNEAGKNSKIRNLSIEAYREEKARQRDHAHG